ncbi:MAG TPA: PEGA domain-containing protein [Tepidisphaeraceae bacterium]|nr:PEGA domain-containing protein [Tepidisphaeraceae bacterium]
MALSGKIGCLALLAMLTGCAQRTLFINSEPQGALVYLNGEEVGRTPLKYDFLWYADYDVTLRKEGYETLKTNRKLKAPIYMWVPFDLFSEMLGVKDTREWTFTMAPANPQAANPQELFGRAEQLKGELRSTKYTRKPTTLPTTLPTTEPLTQPVTEPTEQPTAEPLTQPVTEPSTQPTTEPLAQPTTEPTTQPATTNP